MLAAARNGDTPFLKPAAELIEVDFLTGGLHVEKALDEVHPLTILEDVAGEGFVEGGFVVSKVVKCLAGLGKGGVLVTDKAVGAQGELGVVGEFALVVIGSLVSGEITVADGRLEGFPVGSMLVRQLQKDREVDLGRGEFATEGKVAARHRGAPGSGVVSFGARRGQTQRELQVFAAVAFEEFCHGMAYEPSHGDTVLLGHGGEFGIFVFVEGDGEAGFGGHGVLFYVKLSALKRLSSDWFMVVHIRQSVKWLVLAGLLAAVSLASAAGEVRVIDGDTLEVGAETIRLWGIDAPEGGQRCQRAGVTYDCGAAARAALLRLVEGRAVRCEARYKDRYGRTVARCFTGSVDLGAELVRQGWALDYERYSKGHYGKDQAEAKSEGHGVWSGTFAPPWEWRHSSSKP